MVECSDEYREMRKQDAIISGKIVDLEKEMRKCQLCPLCETRLSVVTSRGNPGKGVVMFVGEAPGAFEDMEGRAFVGQSGEVLNDWLKYMGMPNYYITNVIKCRPPDNRNPTKVEIELCVPFLKEELRIIQPKVIVMLGRISEEVLKFYYMPKFFMYHPAYFLRSKESWQLYVDVLKRRIEAVLNDDNKV